MKRPFNAFLLLPCFFWALLAAPATWGLQDIEPNHPRLIQALNLAEQQDHERAQDLVALARLEGADAAMAAATERRIAELKKDQLMALENRLQETIQAKAPGNAHEILVQLVALGIAQEKVVGYRKAIDNIERYGDYAPGQVIVDRFLTGDRLAPELVVIPEGQFMMGSSSNERGRADHEGPRHRVVLSGGFALGRFEVTVEEFRLFVEDTGHRTDAERSGRGKIYDPRTRRITEQPGVHWRLDYRGKQAQNTAPVIHVSWRDAQAYVAWLSHKTAQAYRLPSEAEFEYALRAGSQWAFPWGAGMPTELVENFAGDGDRSPTQARWSVSFPDYADGHWGPAPVGQFQANAMGLYDMGGNVMEWTQDCWHDSYVRAPADGSAWVNRGCRQHVVRGGSWASTPLLARSAHRLAMAANQSDVRVGFRVARDLNRE